MAKIDDYLFYYVSFDLNQKALDMYYPGNSTKSAYSDIKKFFLKMNFEHEQGSCYCSIDTMSKAEWLYTQGELFDELPWLRICASKINVTMIPQKQISYNVLEEVNNNFSNEELEKIKENFANTKKREIKVSRWRKL